MSDESLYNRFTFETVPPEKQTAWWFVFSGNRLLLLSGGQQPCLPFTADLVQLNITPVRTQYLGKLDGHPCYSAEVAANAESPDGTRFTDLRASYEFLGEDLFLLAGRAYQIVCWDQTHQYCGKCGAPTQTHKTERAKICPKCGLTNYPRISPAIIVAVLKDKQILLAHNKSFGGKMYSLIAGFAEPGENLELCVRREIMEEVGITVKNIKYFGSQPWPFPNSLMIGFTAEYESGDITVDGEEIDDAGWYDRENLPELPLVMSIARKIIDRLMEDYL